MARLVLLVGIFHLALFSSTIASSMMPIVGTNIINFASLGGAVDTATGMLYQSGPGVVASFNPSTQAVDSISTPPLPVTGTPYSGVTHSVRVVDWLDRKFLTVCTDAHMFIVLLDSDGKISNQTVKKSFNFDYTSTTAASGIIQCVPSIDASNALTIWAVVKDGTTSTFLISLLPSDPENPDQLWLPRQTYSVSNCPLAKDFVINPVSKWGYILCDPNSVNTLVAFSLQQPAPTGAGVEPLAATVVTQGSGGRVHIATDTTEPSVYVASSAGTSFLVDRLTYDPTAVQLHRADLASPPLIEAPNFLAVDSQARRFFTLSAAPTASESRIRRWKTDAFIYTAESAGSIANGSVAGTTNLTTLALATCNSASSQCSACLASDSVYCQWCASSTYVGCKYFVDCPASPSQQLSLGTCPVVTSAVPASGATTGGGLISLYGTAFPNDTMLSCIFSTSSANASVSGKYEVDGSVTCQAPSSAAASAASVRLGFDAQPISDNGAAYNYYDCSQFTNCSSCASAANRDCVWCAIDAVCSSRYTRHSVCPSSFSTVVDSASDTTLRCAQLLSVSPQSELTVPPSGAHVVVHASYLVNSTTGWQCKFGDADPVAATIDLVTARVTCPVPTYPVASFRGWVSLTILYRSTVYALNSLEFYFYDCGISNEDCSSCVNNLQPRCTWCLSQKSCYVNGSSSALTCPDTSAATCPVIQPSPRSSYENEQAVVDITGGPFTAIASNTYQCMFGSAGTVPATFVNSAHLQCTAPSVSLGTAAILDVKISIIHNGAIYANASQVFRFYNCQGTTCGTCAGTLTPRCSWCFSEAYCDLATVVAASTCASPVSACPQVTDITPRVGADHGNLTINIVGTQFFSTLSYNCDFTPPVGTVGFSPISVPATFVSATQMSCVTPAFPTNGTWSFAVSTGPQVLDSSFDFRVIKCSAQAACGDCTLTSQCSWCPVVPGCIRSNQTCSLGVPLASCPSIVSINPNGSEIWRPTSISVDGALLDRALFGSTIDSLVCTFGTGFDDVTTATAGTSPGGGLSRLVCDSPIQPAPSTVQVGVSIIDLTGRSVPFVSGPSFEYFDCRRAFDCRTCAANPSARCGWCLTTDSCGPIEQCPQQQFWTSSTCPALSTVSPTFVDILAPAMPITITGSLFDASLDLVCTFDNQDATATVIDSNTLTCIPPTRASGGIATLIVRKRGSPSPFTTGALQFEYISCNRNFLTPVGTCRNCVPALDSRCGWCLLDQRCAPSGSCSGQASNSTYLTSTCPSLVSVSPSIALSTNATTITVVGTHFANVTGLACRFGTFLSTELVVIDDNTITCQTPPLDSLTEDVSVDFGLVVNGNEYAENKLGFRFQIPIPPTTPGNFTVPPTTGSILSEPLPGWVYAVIIIAILVVIAIAVVVSVLYARRRRAADQLIQPDYNAIAWANNTRLMQTVPSDRAPKLNAVSLLVLDYDYEIPVMMAQLSSAGEDDMLSRALVYAAYKNGRALDMLLHMIDYEIGVADVEQEGELFRSNSLACKMFTIYSKVIGLEYLWNTLARPINSLNKAGEAEDLKAGKAPSNEVNLLDVGTMEVDPERLAEKFESDVDAHVLAEVSASQYQLLLYCGRIFKRLVDSLDHVPIEFRTVASRVKQGVAKKFTNNNADFKAVGAFFFLRFVCPAVMTPQVYGLLPNSPSETPQRYFVLISKVLQNLANETLPGDKEEYMAPMNSFVKEHLGSYHKFVEKLSEDDTSKLSAVPPIAPSRTVPDDLHNSSLAYMHNFLVEHDTDLDSKFASDNVLVPKIRDCTGEVGPVFKSAATTVKSASKAKGAKKK